MQDLFDLETAKYLKQQAELYGSEFDLDEPLAEAEAVKIPTSAKGELLNAFYTEINNCQLCTLGKTRTKFVFGIGNPDADLMLIGEAPGESEDLQGEPFVGRAGKLLDRILAAIGFSRSDVYIANVLKCRPPNNRDPLKGESDTCKPYLKRQIEIIEPKIILALGRISGNWLLNEDRTLGSMRNQIFQYEGIDMMVTYHPAALLRNPNWKRPCWEDIQKVKTRYDELSG